MSTITVSYPVKRILFTDFGLYCPKCGQLMTIFNLWKIRKRQKDRHEGATAECNTGCQIHFEGKWQKLMFYNYDVWELKKAVQDWEKKIILDKTDAFCRSKYEADKLRETVKK